MKGKIIKGIAGFYYVHVIGHGVYECKAKGIFRNQKVKPLVGDDVEITVLDEKAMIGNIIALEKRKSELLRPAVANVDQAMVIFALTDPAPNFNLLDRFLIMMDRQKVETLICFNKRDLVDEEEMNRLKEAYTLSGCSLLFISNYTKEGIDGIKKVLEGKTTVLAGPSGVGKSSLLNILKPEAHMEIGSISEKIKRGKHTTRHSEIFHLEGSTYVMDTPGFTSLYIHDFEKEELKDYFPEFHKYEEDCRFKGCLHIHEPDCGVKKALEEGKISRIRYGNYIEMYEELKDIRKY